MPCTIDIIGLGAGVYDRLKEQRLPVAAHQGSQRAARPDKFKNRRSEVWWTFRVMMEEELIDLDPEDDILAAQLGSVKWGVDSSGRIYVETREDIRERGLPSPDRADAAILATVAPAAMPDPNMMANLTVTKDLLTKVM